jgi:hypothetical protein
VSSAATQHTTQPRTRITVQPIVTGFRVHFLPGLEFDAILAEFKAAIPKATRGYVGNHWHVAKRAERRLLGFLDSLHDRADVVCEDRPEPATAQCRNCRRTLSINAGGKGFCPDCGLWTEIQNVSEVER